MRHMISRAGWHLENAGLRGRRERVRESVCEREKERERVKVGVRERERERVKVKLER